MKLRSLIPLLAVAAALGACHGSGGGSPPAAGSGDAFVAQTQQLAAGAPEDADASDVDSVNVTTPEDAEAADVG